MKKTPMLQLEKEGEVEGEKQKWNCEGGGLRRRGRRRGGGGGGGGREEEEKEEEVEEEKEEKKSGEGKEKGERWGCGEYEFHIHTRECGIMW
jgi:hypothetical protein